MKQPSFVQKLKLIHSNGNCDLRLVMKQPHNKQYYVGMAQKLGVSYISVNNQKKTPTQILEEIRNKNK